MTTANNWRSTRLLVSSDAQRLRDALEAAGLPHRKRLWGLLLTPELTCLALYRISHYCFGRGRHRLAAILYRLNITLTGADIHPATVIGPACLLVHPVGTVLFGTFGQRVTIYARVIVAPDLPIFRIAQAPRVGDDVVLGSGSTVLGDVFIAPHCHIAPASLIDMSIHETHSMISRMPGERLVRKRIAAGVAANDGAAS